MVPPDDLVMRQVIEAADTMPDADGTEGSKFGEKVPVTTPGIGYVLESAGRFVPYGAARLVIKSPAPSTDTLVQKLLLVNSNGLRKQLFWAVDVMYTPYSQSGLLSGHWLPCNAALELSTQEELFRTPLRPVEEPRPPQMWLEWRSSPGTPPYYGNGRGTPLQATVEDRGSMNSNQRFSTPTAGEQLVLTPVLGILDGNGWRLSMNLTGPSSFRRSFEITRRPNPLGDLWILSDFEVQFPNPGQYMIELVGDVLWPTRSYTVRYTLTVAVSSQFSAPLKTEDLAAPVSSRAGN